MHLCIRRGNYAHPPGLNCGRDPAEHPRASADEVIRTLVDLIEIVSEPRAVDASGGDSNPSEEVLVDTEVDGCRYLLVRMPKRGRGRIRLSPREQEIVRMVAKGHPNKVIADVLNISSWSVHPFAADFRQAGRGIAGRDGKSAPDSLHARRPAMLRTKNT